MRYMLIICDEEQLWDRMPEPEQTALMAEYRKWIEECRAAGAYLSGDRLQPVASATTVRVRNGKTLLTDGPFAETKEQFGGYLLIDVPDLDAALEWAAKVPSARLGSIEVRPVWE